MTELYIVLSALLFCGAIACLFMASGFDKYLAVQPGESCPPLSQRFSWRWLVAGVMCLAATVGVFVFLSGPSGDADALEEAKDLARQTFRGKVGREPDSLEMQHEQWKPYVGTARVGDEVWDVEVTRTAPQGARRTVTMECTLTRRDP